MQLCTSPILAGVGPVDIDQALSTAEEQVLRHEGLEGTGFWKAVSLIKGDPDLVERYADRVAAIDRKAFEDWALVRMAIWPGTALMLLATLVGLLLVGWAYYLDGLAAVIAFYAGFGILLTTTHGLAHLLVGRIAGIRFVYWFIGTIVQPQPGVKIDYSTYLRTPPRERAWMHAAGALTTKIVPFALIGAAVAASLPVWAVIGLPVIGSVTIVTDILWSTNSSDWKKFSREMSFAQSP